MNSHNKTCLNHFEYELFRYPFNILSNFSLKPNYSDQNKQDNGHF